MTSQYRSFRYNIDACFAGSAEQVTFYMHNRCSGVNIEACSIADAQNWSIALCKYLIIFLGLVKLAASHVCLHPDYFVQSLQPSLATYTLWRSLIMRKLLGHIKCMRYGLLWSIFLESVSLRATRLYVTLLCKQGWTDQGPAWGGALGDLRNIVFALHEGFSDPN